MGISAFLSVIVIASCRLKGERKEGEERGRRQESGRDIKSKSQEPTTTGDSKKERSASILNIHPSYNPFRKIIIHPSLQGGKQQEKKKRAQILSYMCCPESRLSDFPAEVKLRYIPYNAQRKLILGL